MVTPAAHREAAAYLQTTYEMSQRRACRVLSTDRTSVRYQSTRPDDGALRERLKALAQERRRFGYRRLHVLLRREGQVVCGSASKRDPARTVPTDLICMLKFAHRRGPYRRLTGSRFWASFRF